MGFLGRLKQSLSKAKLMKSAAKQVEAGRAGDAANEIFAFYQTDPSFQLIISTFKATPADIESIMLRLMFSGAGGKYRGLYVPVSAVLVYDTLAYLLRSERGQVQKAQAYSEVMDYFQKGKMVFEPERAFH